MAGCCNKYIYIYTINCQWLDHYIPNDYIMDILYGVIYIYIYIYVCVCVSYNQYILVIVYYGDWIYYQLLDHFGAARCKSPWWGDHVAHWRELSRGSVTFSSCGSFRSLRRCEDSSNIYIYMCMYIYIHIFIYIYIYIYIYTYLYI